MKGSFSGSLAPEVKSATSKLDTECCRSPVVSFRNGATRHRTREKYGPGEREIVRGGTRVPVTNSKSLNFCVLVAEYPPDERQRKDARQSMSPHQECSSVTDISINKSESKDCCRGNQAVHESDKSVRLRTGLLRRSTRSRPRECVDG